ncbi:MAG: hypothetical protein AAF526_02085 [Pseudomonadota bacterium]
MVKRIDREGPIHMECLRFLRRRLPARAAKTIWHTPNENAHKVQFRKRLRDLGLKSGVGDISFVWDGAYYEIEVKADSRQSPDQVSRQSDLWAAGARYAVVHCIQDLEDALGRWGVPLLADEIPAARAG